MKRSYLFVGVLAILVVLTLSNSFIHASGSEVIYRGKAAQFVVAPQSTDLFQNFKGLMPGDRIQQLIMLKNDTDKKVRIFLRGEAPSEKEANFLKEVILKGSVGSKAVFDYRFPAADLTDRVLLKELKARESVDLLVELELPTTLNNDYQSEEYTLVWIFMVEEDQPDDNDNPPRTGVSATYMIAGSLFLLAAAATVTTLIVARKRSRHN